MCYFDSGDKYLIVRPQTIDYIFCGLKKHFAYYKNNEHKLATGLLTDIHNS